VAVIQRIQTKLMGRDPGFAAAAAAGGDDALGASVASAVSASQQQQLLLHAQLQQAGGLSVEEQVDRLIRQATAVENLCQLFFGWCPWA
jgi:hypothetical protein